MTNEELELKAIEAMNKYLSRPGDYKIDFTKMMSKLTPNELDELKTARAASERKLIDKFKQEILNAQDVKHDDELVAIIY